MVIGSGLGTRYRTRSDTQILTHPATNSHQQLCRRTSMFYLHSEKASYTDGIFTRAAQNGRQTELEETPKVPTEPAAMAAGNKKRPRLDLNAAEGNRERKRGKSMFGILVGTLNKAKIEDKERNASEAVSITTSTTQHIAQMKLCFRPKNDN